VGNDENENMLDQSESLDSDEVRNDDGDEVVDPPDHWIEADEHDSDEGGALDVVSNYDLDRIDPEEHGRQKGQIDGTPEDGDSFYNVER
jgi:hypothetical protein